MVTLSDSPPRATLPASRCSITADVMYLPKVVRSLSRSLSPSTIVLKPFARSSSSSPVSHPLHVHVVELLDALERRVHAAQRARHDRREARAEEDRHDRGHDEDGHRVDRFRRTMRVDVGHVERGEHADRCRCVPGAAAARSAALPRSDRPASTMVVLVSSAAPKAPPGNSCVCADELVVVARVDDRECQLEPELRARVLRYSASTGSQTTTPPTPGDGLPDDVRGRRAGGRRLAPVLDDAAELLAARQVGQLGDPVDLVRRVLAADLRENLPGLVDEQDVDVRVDVHEHLRELPRALGVVRAGWRAPSPRRPRGCARRASRSARSSSSSVWNAFSASVTRSSTSSTSCRCRSHDSTGSAASMTTAESDTSAVSLARTVGRRSSIATVIVSKVRYRWRRGSRCVRSRRAVLPDGVRPASVHVRGGVIERVDAYGAVPDGRAGGGRGRPRAPARARRHPRPRERAGSHGVGGLRDGDARGRGRRGDDDRRHAAQRVASHDDPRGVRGEGGRPWRGSLRRRGADRRRRSGQSSASSAS